VDFKLQRLIGHCTKGLWLWSVPLKRTALDGTEYNLILLDSEGIDAYDQTVRICHLCFTLILHQLDFYVPCNVNIALS